MLDAALLVACANLLQPAPVRIDLDADTARQAVVDREPGVYLGHVSTVLLDDHHTILAAYPKGHGSGPVILKRSADAGRTWSERLPTPASWATSKETPTLFNLGEGRLVMFSGLYPIRAARSADHGATWSELEPIGDFGGIVAMGDVVRTAPPTFTAFFHDDGRFFHNSAKASGTFTLYQTSSRDDGATWDAPRSIWSGSDIHLCEPGAVQSPDGSTLALLLRENRRARNSHIITSTDHAATWSAPRELPRVLTGDRHTARYAPDGRLVVTFRCMAKEDPWSGDWVAWVGTWDDLVPSSTARADTHPQYFVRLKDNLTDWDCAYPGLHCMPDATFVATTYGTWSANEKPSILSVRFTLADLDARATK